MVWMVNSKTEHRQQSLSAAKTRLKHRLQQAGLTIAALLVVVSGFFSYAMPSDAAFLKAIDTKPWETVKLPSDESPLDVDFLPDSPEQGWIVGTNSSIFQTADGGASWQEKKLDLGTEKYRLTSVSFAGQEGWIAGQPSILLHTKDGGVVVSNIKYILSIAVLTNIDLENICTIVVDVGTTRWSPFDKSNIACESRVGKRRADVE